MDEWTGEAAVAVSLARTVHADTGRPAALGVACHRRPAGKPSRGRTLSCRLRGLAGRVATWCERWAAADRLARTFDRDLADLGLSRAPARGVSQRPPPTRPPLPPHSGGDGPARPPPRSGLLRPALACALCALLAIAGVLALDALGVAPPAPGGEDPIATLDGP